MTQTGSCCLVPSQVGWCHNKRAAATACSWHDMHVKLLFTNATKPCTSTQGQGTSSRQQCGRTDVHPYHRSPEDTAALRRSVLLCVLSMPTHAVLAVLCFASLSCNIRLLKYGAGLVPAIGSAAADLASFLIGHTCMMLSCNGSTAVPHNPVMCAMLCYAIACRPASRHRRCCC